MATVETIGKRASHCHEEERWREFGKTEKTKIEVAPGHVIDLFAQSSDLNHRGNG